MLCTISLDALTFLLVRKGGLRGEVNVTSIHGSDGLSEAVLLFLPSLEISHSTRENQDSVVQSWVPIKTS